MYCNQARTYISNTTASVFNVSTNLLNVSVNQLVARGIPIEKIVIGKPATLTDDTSKVQYIGPSVLGQGLSAQYLFKNHTQGVLVWQYSSDPNGTIIKSIMSPLNQTLNGKLV